MPSSIATDDRAIVARLDPRDRQVVRGLLDDLVESGLIEPLAAERAFQAQRQTGERIDVVLVQLGLLTDDALLAALARHFRMEIAAPHDYPAVAVLPDQLQPDFLARAGMLPLAETPLELTIAVSSPFAADTLAAVAYLTDRRVSAKLGRARDIDEARQRLYGATSEQPGAAGPAAAGTTVAQDDDVQRLRDIASEAPVIRLVNRLIGEAIAQKASDVHIEPQADALRVRYRIDGVMAEVERLPLELQAGVASRIKILGRLNIAERRVPQDGRTKFVLGGREIDLRISTTPLMHGESLVLRILDRDQVDLDFPELGFDDKAQATLKSLIDAPNGIVLVTGPTGSGKTTTLYAALKSLNSAERKIFTVEDPIEYQLAGINQMQIKPAIGLDFVHCLRSILRQDPDIVMIGEMRDVETVRTGIQASLTGHLVLSTLHTNSAAASVTRLIDMGAEDYLIASTLSGIVAQRLVRRLCPQCARPDDDGGLDALEPAARTFFLALPNHTVKHPVGCPVCRQTGYQGRTTIAEILVVDGEVRRMIARGVTDRQLAEVARSRGMETLLENGLRKVAAGETTLAEVLRVARM